MDLSILLAKVIGLYAVIVPLALLLNTKLRTSLFSVFKNNVALFFSGLVSLGIGILLVLHHNVWVSDWRVIITVFGWMALLKGLTRIFWPDVVIGWIKKMEKGNWAKVILIVGLLLGLYLSFVGLWMG